MTEYLTLTPGDMRRFGYRVIDLIVDHLESLPSSPALKIATPETLQAALARTLPEAPSDMLEVLEQVREHVVGNISACEHPRFFAFVPGPSNFVGVMADAIAAGFNICASNWTESSGAAELERLTVSWLAQLCGMPGGAGGTFLSGGSMANLSAIAVAREILLGEPDSSAQVYCSDQAHMSVARGLKVLGFARDQLRLVPTDEDYRLDVAALTQMIAEDAACGKRPFCIVANGGTTNTGSVDPLRELAALCDEQGLWLHVDGAYGAGSILSERGRAELDGIGLAHSITLDPHKWLFQPIECGCLLVRDQRWLRQTFDQSPEYLSDVDAAYGEINIYQRGIQLTRGTRALKLWMSLQVFGAAAFRDAIDVGFANAEYVQAKVGQMADWEIVSPARMGIVSFRYVPSNVTGEALNELNQAITDELTAAREIFIATTVLRGVKALRMCPINPRTTQCDLDETLAAVDAIARRWKQSAAAP